MIKVKGIAFHEKKLVVADLDMMTKKKEYVVYIDEGYTKLKQKERDEILTNPRTGEYLLVIKESMFKGTLKEYYDELIADADKLKLATKGKVNMYKTGGYSKTALKLLFDILNENDIIPEQIDDYETRFLINSGGAFRLSRPYEGPMYKYDVRSYYTSVYSSSKLLIPIKKGILKTITQEQLESMKYFELGVYHCKIEKPTGNLKKLVWVNPENYYTHYELSYIREKGLKIEMIDEEDNFLNYPRSHCKTGSEIFGEFAKMLYKLKEDNVCQGAKKLLNHLWGALCKKNKKVIIYNINDPPLEDDAYEMLQIDDENFEVTFLREQKFEYDLARMKPFFLAKCRLTIAKTIEPFVDHVFYSHTDSIISDIPLNLKDNGKLGDFRYEGYCENGFVKNGMSRTHNNNFIC